MEKIKADLPTSSKKTGSLDERPVTRMKTSAPQSIHKDLTEYQRFEGRTREAMMHVGRETGIEVHFPKLFKTFIESVDLFADTDPANSAMERLKVISVEKMDLSRRIHESTPKEKPPLEVRLKAISEEERTRLKTLRGDLEIASTLLPGIYQKNYCAPVLASLASLQNRSSGTLETLAGAVYDHANPEVARYVRPFLAFTSNLYRSFLEPERLPLSNFPQPNSTLPGLVTFRPKLDLNINNPHFVPFTLPVDEVERLCGSTVAVISLPSCYRNHPVLSWGCVAHEAGGHDVLHSYPGLLQELKQGVRELFYQGSDPHGGRIEGERQFLGLLWQHWTEEAAADVYAVMNLGPAYGIGMTTYLAALSERIRTEYLYSFPGNSRRRDGLAALAVSSRDGDTYVDYHPTKLLSLYVIIGAIDGLRTLSEPRKNQYINAITECINECLKGNEVLTKMGRDIPALQKFVSHYATDGAVRIRGAIRLKSGFWVNIPDNSYCALPLNALQECARDVGYYIATAKLRAFNGYSIQDLETWDDSDEMAADQVARHIMGSADDVSDKGDDAQIFAGAIQALAADPDQYVPINNHLLTALDASFRDDQVWGVPTWHPIADGWKRKNPSNGAHTKRG